MYRCYCKSFHIFLKTSDNVKIFDLVLTLWACMPNTCLEPSFHGMSRLFVLSLKNITCRVGCYFSRTRNNYRTRTRNNHSAGRLKQRNFYPKNLFYLQKTIFQTKTFFTPS